MRMRVCPYVAQRWLNWHRGSDGVFMGATLLASYMRSTASLTHVDWKHEGSGFEMRRSLRIGVQEAVWQGFLRSIARSACSASASTPVALDMLSVASTSA